MDFNCEMDNNWDMDLNWEIDNNRDTDLNWEMDNDWEMDLNWQMDYKWDIDFGLVPIPPFKSRYPVLFQLSRSILDIPS